MLGSQHARGEMEGTPRGCSSVHVQAHARRRAAMAPRQTGSCVGSVEGERRNGGRAAQRRACGDVVRTVRGHLQGSAWCMHACKLQACRQGGRAGAGAQVRASTHAYLGEIAVELLEGLGGPGLCAPLALGVGYVEGMERGAGFGQTGAQKPNHTHKQAPPNPAAHPKHAPDALFLAASSGLALATFSLALIFLAAAFSLEDRDTSFFLGGMVGAVGSAQYTLR